MAQRLDEIGACSEARDGSGTMRAPGIYGRGQLGMQGKDEAWPTRSRAAADFLGGGVRFGYDGGKGRHQQVVPTSQRGKKAGSG